MANIYGQRLPGETKGLLQQEPRPPALHADATNSVLHCRCRADCNYGKVREPQSAALGIPINCEAEDKAGNFPPYRRLRVLRIHEVTEGPDGPEGSEGS